MKGLTEGVVLLASRISLEHCTFLKTQNFQKIFVTARSPNHTAVKHYRFNDCRVVCLVDCVLNMDLCDGVHVLPTFCITPRSGN